MIAQMTAARIAHAVSVLLLLLLFAECALAESDRLKLVVDDGHAALAICIPNDASPIVRYAANVLQQRIDCLSGRKPAIRSAPVQGKAIVLADAASGKRQLSQAERDALTDEAYLARFVENQDGRQLMIVGGSDRAILYGVARLADLDLQWDDGVVVLETDNQVHAPALSVRGNYTLACHGETHLFTRQHWQHIFDTMAADSMNLTMFWLSGLFRSKQHPESVVYPETKLSTADIQALVRHAHERGIRFLLGTGVFAWFGVDAIAERFPDSKAVGSGGMCPSNPLARRLNMEYVLEMLDTFPEADGLFLEIRDEYGPCRCETCQQKLDDYGSKRYGQAELSFLRELAEQIWRRKPNAVLVSAIGYGEESQGAHTNDVLFYEGIREMNDPRFHWLVCRRNWDFPASGGDRKLIRHFSDRMLQWCQYYRLSTAEIGQWIRRSHDAGCAGFCPALEPGFCSASWYSDEIPYPVDAIPYVITRFAYREYCWNPDMSEDEFRGRLLRRFFGRDAPPKLADDLLLLFDVIRRESQKRGLAGHGKWARGCAARMLEEAESALAAAEESAEPMAVSRRRLRELHDVVERQSEEIREIERRLTDATPRLSPRGRETAAVMQKALADTKRELCLDPEAAKRVRETFQRAEQLAEERRRNRPVTAEASSQWNDTTYEAFNAVDGDLDTSWLCEDRAPLPQTLTITFRQKHKIDYVRIVQGTYHAAYNTRKYHVEYSADGKSFRPLSSGELENRLGNTQKHQFSPVEPRALRIVISSVYPNVAYSSPSLAEVDVGLAGRSALTGPQQ